MLSAWRGRFQWKVLSSLSDKINVITRPTLALIVHGSVSIKELNFNRIDGTSRVSIAIVRRALFRLVSLGFRFVAG